MASRAPDTPTDSTLQLLGWWELHLDDRGVALGRREQRLVALLALAGRRSRLQVAGTLWPDSSEHHAMSNLRAAVFQTRQHAPDLLSAQSSTLDLGAHITVDVGHLRCYAGRVADSPEAYDATEVVAQLGEGDLLPGWYDDWVLFERERLQHLRLRALEAVARASLQAGRAHEATAAARAAVRIEPLHEGANVLLVRGCLAAGSPVDAVRHFHGYRRRLELDLGIRPSGTLAELVRPLLLPSQRKPAPAPQRARR